MFYVANEEHPCVMSAYLTLFDEVDGEALTKAVEALRDRFPYFYVRAKAIEQELRPIPNPLPVCVRNSWEHAFVGSKENNYHLIGVSYEGKRLRVEISTCLTDGDELMPYLKALMFLYLKTATGKRLNPAGLRLPGTDFEPGELGCPYPLDEVAKVKKPLSIKKPVDFYRLEEGPVVMDGRKRLFFLQLSGEDMLDYCRMNDGSPNALLCVLMAKVIRAVDPACEKALLGNYENYHYASDLIGIEFPADHVIEDMSTACTIARGQIIAQTATDNVLYAIKQRKGDLEKMDMLGLVELKMNMLKNLRDKPMGSAIVSYTGNRTLGDADAYVDEFYCINDVEGTDILLENNYLNGIFYLTVIQNFSSGAYVQALLAELAAIGIEGRLVSAEDNWTAVTRLDDVM